MAKKRLCDENMAGVEEAKRMEMKYASLKEDYLELQRDIRAMRKRVWRNRDKKKQLQGDVRLLRHKYQMFTEKDCSADPLVSPESGAKALSVYRRPNEPTEVLAIEDEPARCELNGLQPLMSTAHRTTPEKLLQTGPQPSAMKIMPGFKVPLSSTDDCTKPEMTGLQISAMKIMTDFTVPHSSLVTPIVEPANKKRRLKNNELESAQNLSNVKDGRNKKIKTAPLVSQECGAENLSIHRRAKEPTEALPIEDRSAIQEFTGLQLFLSSDACTLPETTGLKPSTTRLMPAFAVPPNSMVTSVVKPAIKKKLLENNGLVRAWKPPKVKDSQRKKIKNSPQKLISLIEEQGVESFWDN